jgi:hypothetical protein
VLQIDFDRMRLERRHLATASCWLPRIGVAIYVVLTRVTDEKTGKVTS